MAPRVVKSLPKVGTVSRAKVRAAAKVAAKAHTGARGKKTTVTKANTASGRKQISFKRVGTVLQFAKA